MGMVLVLLVMLVLLVLRLLVLVILVIVLTGREWDQLVERVGRDGGYIDLADAIATADRLKREYGVLLGVISNEHYTPDASKQRYILADPDRLTPDTPLSSIYWLP